MKTLRQDLRIQCDGKEHKNSLTLNFSSLSVYILLAALNNICKPEVNNLFTSKNWTRLS